MAPPSKCFVLSITFGFLCWAQTSRATQLTSRPQFAEAYDDESVQFQVSSVEEDPALNTIVIKQLEQKRVLKSLPKLKRFHSGDDFMDVSDPYIHPDDPYYTVHPELLSRHKRDVPAWQALYRSRFQAYTKQKEEEARRRKPKSKKAKKSKVPGRTKFARQFDGDETVSAEDNTLTETRQQQNDVADNFSNDAVPVPTVQETQPPEEIETTTTTTTERATKKRKKNKRTTTTTTTAAPEEETQEAQEEVTTSAPTKPPKRTTPNIPTPSRNAKNNDLETIVMAIAADMRDQGPYVPQEGEEMPLWARKDLDTELYPASNDDLKQLIVDKHNILRSSVSPPAGNMLKMEWNEEAAKVAQSWAEQCHFEHDPGEVRKTKHFSCGQNLARGWPSPLSWNLTMQLWFDEYKDFKFDAPPSGLIGHYTALVWATSFQVGCGYADCGTFHHYVCNYCPSGNIDVRRWHPYQPASKSCALCPNDCDETGKLCTNTCKYTNKYGNCDDLEKEFQICSDASYGLQDKCQATCKCKGKIYERPKP